MKKLKLGSLGVQQLGAIELMEIEGGQLPSWMKGGIWGAIGYEIMDSWQVVKIAVSDGWNGTYNNKY